MTARNAIYGIQRKLNVETMQGLVLWCARNGLLHNYTTSGLGASEHVNVGEQSHEEGEDPLTKTRTT